MWTREGQQVKWIPNGKVPYSSERTLECLLLAQSGHKLVRCTCLLLTQSGHCCSHARRLPVCSLGLIRCLILSLGGTSMPIEQSRDSKQFSAFELSGLGHQYPRLQFGLRSGGTPNRETHTRCGKRKARQAGAGYLLRPRHAGGGHDFLRCICRLMTQSGHPTSSLLPLSGGARFCAIGEMA